MDEPKNFKIPKALRLKALGYHFMPLICLALFVLSVWELSVRMDAMSGPLSMFFDMARGEGIPLMRALQYMEWSILEPLVYLVCCMAAALVCLLCCRRPIGSIITAPFCAALGIYALARTSDALPGIWHLLPGLLLMTMTAFSLLNLSTYRIRQRNLIMSLRTVREQNAPPLPRTESLEKKSKSLFIPEYSPDEIDIPADYTSLRNTSVSPQTCASSDGPHLTDAPRLRRLAQSHPTEADWDKERDSVDHQSA